MIALALAFVVGQVQPPAVGLRSALVTTTAGEVLQLDGGVWLRDDVAIQNAEERLALRAENKTLKAAPVATPPVVVAASVVALVFGAAFGAATVCSITTGSPVCAR